MDSLTTQFNAQAHWATFIAPLLMLLILDDIERKEKRRRNRLSDQFRRFARADLKQRRKQYARQVAAGPTPRL